MLHPHCKSLTLALLAMFLFSLQRGEVELTVLKGVEMMTVKLWLLVTGLISITL